jgi:cyclopropane-fatty-acyl-phospholipid synthase
VSRSTTHVPLGARVVDAVIDRGMLPDPLLRASMRALLRRRLAEERAGGAEAISARKRALFDDLRTSPVAVHTDEANEQHYEVPTEFFELMLGPHLKYSSAYWPRGVQTLQQAEEAMLRLTCERAELVDGQDVLELGCGWGSLTLWMAAQYPSSRITAVSNSATQRQFIEKQAAARGLDNVTVVTRDVNVFGTDDTAEFVAGGFDRAVSVEMFEHVRNHTTLTDRIASWLRPGGKLFVHVFANREVAYPFDTGGSGDWMARHFFTGGLMPSDDLLLHTVESLTVEDHWVVSGEHYARTLEAWTDRMWTHRERILQLFADTYGADRAEAWFQRWRVFNTACAELFAYAGGDEWWVSHYRFVKPV